MKNKILKTILFAILTFNSLVYAGSSVTSCGYRQSLGKGKIHLYFDVSSEFTGDVSVEYLGKNSPVFYFFYIDDRNNRLSMVNGLCAFIDNRLEINLTKVIDLEKSAEAINENQSRNQIYQEEMAVKNGHRQAIKKVLESFVKTNQ